MKRLELRGKEGKFVDDDGNVVDDPGPTRPFVIVAALWAQGMPVGARQEKCKRCQRFVGIAPATQKMVDGERKVEMILCTDCWELFQAYEAIHE
jgi:hypothetical protein